MATPNIGYSFANWTDSNGNVFSSSAFTTYEVVAATTLTANFVRIRLAQTITFGQIATQIVGMPTPLNATASSGLPVAFISLTPGTCSVIGNTAAFLAAGQCAIQALQTGDGIYDAAPIVQRSFNVVMTIPAQVTAAPFVYNRATSVLSLK